MSKEDDINELLRELEEETPVESGVKKKSKPVEEINDANAKDVIYASLAKVLNQLGRVSEELTEKVESGDTYESTLMGISSAATTIVNGIGKLDAIEARKQKMAHEEKMIELKSKKKKEEIELKGIAAPKAGGNTQINNFIGDRESFLKACNGTLKIDPENSEVVGID